MILQVRIPQELPARFLQVRILNELCGLGRDLQCLRRVQDGERTELRPQAYRIRSV